MSRPIKLARGGGFYALTTTPAAFDLSALIGFEVMISCDAQDIYFSGATSADTAASLNTGTPAVASSTALIADRVGAGFKAKRLVRRDQPFIIAATVASTGTLRVKVVSDSDPNS